MTVLRIPVTHPPHTVAIATMPPTKKGTIVPKESVYNISEGWFRDDSRGIVAGHGGGSEGIYFCDQKTQGCTASIRWVKQATSSWKMAFFDGKHENCGGAITSASTGGMDHQRAEAASYCQGGNGGDALVVLYPAGEVGLSETSDAHYSSVKAKLRLLLHDLEKHSPGMVGNVEVIVLYLCVCSSH